MSPSRFIKRVYARELKRGYEGSLKDFATIVIDREIECSDREADACEAWFKNKARARKRKPASGHTIVHTVRAIRSTRHACGSNITLRGEVRS